MSINLTIDPTGSSLVLNDRPNGFRVTAFDPGNQPDDTQWASSVDTEGSRRAGTHPQNRTVTARVLVDKSTAAALQTAEQTLTRKIAKLNREGGELLLTLPSTSTITFDVEDAYLTRPFDPAMTRINVAEYELTFICLPYGRGAEQDLGDNTETTNPCLVFTEASIPGDVPALGRLVIDNDATIDQWWLTWGLESRYYSNSANAALFYEAEGRTALGGAATAAGPTGASGGGSNVMRHTTLLSDYQPVLSTQATGGGAHLSHVGTFRVYARVQTSTSNTGLITVALEWSEGDFLRHTLNPGVQIPAAHEGQWRLVDLGLVHLTPVASGTQRWEGRIVAKSTTLAGDDIDVDYLMLVPVAEGSGIASGVQRTAAASAITARDEFTSTTAGNALNARVAPSGGTWATSGAATDFVFSDTVPAGGSGEGISRAASGARYAILSGSSTNIAVKTDMYLQNGLGDRGGVVARWTDANNHLRGTFIDGDLRISTVVAGSETVIASKNSEPLNTSFDGLRELVLIAYANGRITLTMTDELWGTDSITTYSTVTATGGGLASGGIGIVDVGASTTREYDNFSAWVPTADAAVFGSQSLELRHDRIQREDSAGAVWAGLSSYEGDYLVVPASGAESRTVRVIVKMTRDDPFTIDPSIDDLSARLFVTPRYLVVPT